MRNNLLIFIFCILFCKAFTQNVNSQIDKIIENRYAIISYENNGRHIFIYDLINNKIIKKLKNVSSSRLIKSKSSFSIDDYNHLRANNKKLKQVTETFYIYPENYTQEGGDAPHNNDYRFPEKEQIRFNYPYLIDTLSNDSFGVFNLKKQLYFNTHKISGYKLRSVNISPNRTFYYATFNKKGDSKFNHYIFNIANSKYTNLSNYDTSKCSEEEIHRVSFSSNDSFFATINSCEKAIIYKLGKITEAFNIDNKNELIARIEFSPKSKYFIAYSVYENDTTNFYKYFILYDSAGNYYSSSTKYSMTRLQKPLYYVKVWDSKTMKPILNFRTSSIKFGFSEDDSFLALKIENTMIKTFFGYPSNNYSYYKDTTSSSYLSIIDLNIKKEIKQLNIFKNSEFNLEYIWSRQKRPYFIFSSDSKKIITNQYEGYPYDDSQIQYEDIYNINDGKSLLKSINFTRE